MRLTASALGALLTCLAIAACGGQSHPVSRQLATYLNSVNRIEKGLDTPLNQVNSIDRQLTAADGVSTSTQTTTTSTKPVQGALPTSEQEQLLATARRQVAAVVTRLTALAVPGPAEHLQSLVVALARRQESLIGQTQLLAGFAPGYTRALAPLAPDGSRLRKVLAVNGASTSAEAQALDAEKAAALRRFASQLGSILTALGHLRPPSSSLPTYRVERQSLTRLATVSRSLAGDLDAGNATQAQTGLRAFDAASALPSSRAAQIAERDAVKAYDRQITALRTLSVQADQERARLAARYATPGA